MSGDNAFWRHADELVASHRLVIDRPGGSRHPRYPAVTCPFDYGYLDGTGAVDGGGVDAWRGSLPDPVVTGVVVTADVRKGDAEVKLLIGCSEPEMAAALATHRTSSQAALLIRREAAAGEP